MRLRRLLQRIEAEDAERVVDILGRSRSQPRDAGQLEERRRDLALESSQEFQLSARDKLDNLLLHRLTDAGDVFEPSVFDQVLDLGGQVVELPDGDRKSIRLNSSHVRISYAVFCLKKKIETLTKGGHGRCTQVPVAHAEVVYA